MLHPHPKGCGFRLCISDITINYRLLKLTLVEMIIRQGYYFRKYGFLAAAGIHFWTDISWHVVYGMI